MEIPLTSILRFATQERSEVCCAACLANGSGMAGSIFAKASVSFINYGEASSWQARCVKGDVLLGFAALRRSEVCRPEDGEADVLIYELVCIRPAVRIEQQSVLCRLYRGCNQPVEKA